VLITGSCEDVTSRDPPNGLQLLLGTSAQPHVTDTLVMSNLGYFQLKATPGAWTLQVSSPAHATPKSAQRAHSPSLVPLMTWQLAPGPSSEVYQILGEKALMEAGHANKAARRLGRVDPSSMATLPAIRLLIADFSGLHALMFVSKKPGMQGVSILDDDKSGGKGGGGGGGGGGDAPAAAGGVFGSLSKWLGGEADGGALTNPDDDMVHVFSLASGHLYERFLKIMMQSVVQRTQRKVKFWLLKNFLSPAFMGFLPQMAAAVGFEYALVDYQWPSWLHKQTNKQRIIWGYKILFLDVMFPLHLKKIVYIDADQVVNADIGELWDMSLGNRGAAVGMTPFCNKDANGHTTGFRFFAQGYTHRPRAPSATTHRPSRALLPRRAPSRAPSTQSCPARGRR
jgi:UDP-glucose:glycoprotein glucosyltransferase